LAQKLKTQVAHFTVEVFCDDSSLRSPSLKLQVAQWWRGQNHGWSLASAPSEEGQMQTLWKTFRQPAKSHTRSLPSHPQTMQKSSESSLS
jgi:hypothetical protein